MFAAELCRVPNRRPGSTGSGEVGLAVGLGIGSTVGLGLGLGLGRGLALGLGLGEGEGVGVGLGLDGRRDTEVGSPTVKMVLGPLLQPPPRRQATLAFQVPVRPGRCRVHDRLPETVTWRLVALSRAPARFPTGRSRNRTTSIVTRREARIEKEACATPLSTAIRGALAVTTLNARARVPALAGSTVSKAAARAQTDTSTSDDCSVRAHPDPARWLWTRSRWTTLVTPVEACRHVRLVVGAGVRAGP